MVDLLAGRGAAGAGAEVVSLGAHATMLEAVANRRMSRREKRRTTQT
jgi:tRNA(Ile2) C34 agmatinyltransferase TiaS